MKVAVTCMSMQTSLPAFHKMSSIELLPLSQTFEMFSRSACAASLSRRHWTTMDGDFYLSESLFKLTEHIGESISCILRLWSGHHFISGPQNTSKHAFHTGPISSAASLAGNISQAGKSQSYCGCEMSAVSVVNCDMMQVRMLRKRRYAWNDRLSRKIKAALRAVDVAAVCLGALLRQEHCVGSLERQSLSRRILFACILAQPYCKTPSQEHGQMISTTFREACWTVEMS